MAVDTTSHAKLPLETAARSYIEWNDAIVAHFFTAANSGHPVYLQVDSEVLQTIGQQLGLQAAKAEDDFVRAVRQHVLRSDPPFRMIVLNAKYLSRTNCTPEFIAFLAFCVLAASKMERDEELRISSANYYRRLNELLGLERDNAPLHFRDTLIAWEKLNVWLNVFNQGVYGIATARPLSELHPYVGYPQSQCLLRSADRQQLPVFFRWAKLQPEDTPSTEWLCTLLRQWVQHQSCVLLQPTKRRILRGSDEVVGQVAHIAMLELQGWDGLAAASEGGATQARKILLHLRFDSRGRRVIWRAYRVEPAEAVEDRYVPLPMPEGPEGLARELQRSGEAVLAFGSHPDLTDWVQQARVTRGYPTVLLVREAQEQAVRGYLAQRAKQGWMDATWDGIPLGWRCFRGVELSQPDPSARWACLQIPDDVTMRLRGGLKIEQDVYLHGFAPTLELYSPEPIANISLDRQPLLPQPAGLSRIVLANCCGQPGYHTITIGTRSRSFITRDPHRPVLPRADVPRIAYHLRHVDRQYYPAAGGPIVTYGRPPAPGEVYISGALLYGRPEDRPAPLPHVILVPSGFKRYIVLGQQPGQVREHQSPWWWQGGAERHRLIQIEVPFEPQWLVKISKRRYLSALQPTIRPPGSAPIDDPAGIEQWCDWILRQHRHSQLTTAATEILELYRALASRLQQEGR